MNNVKWILCKFAKKFHILFTVMFGVFAGALVEPFIAEQLSFAKGIEKLVELVELNSFWSNKYLLELYGIILGIPAFCIGIILLKRYKDNN